MQPGKRFLVVASVLLSLLADETAARRALSPNQGTVFIRVVGKLRAEYDATWKEFIEEKDMEIGTGSGFVISSYGHVLTNYHVISGRAFSRKVGGIDIRYEMQVQRIEVAFPPGSGRGEESSLAGRFAASVDAVDRELDLALLSVSGADLPYVPLGDSDALAANQPVEVLGFPFGRRVEVAQTSVPDIVPRVSTSRGSVSAVRTREDGMTQFIQTSATVNPGNSGGPMVDEEGYALGVVRLSLAEASGIGFVIPINVVKDFLEEHGLGPLLPVQRLRLDRMGNLEGKGLRLRLVEGQEDRSATRVRVRAGASPDEVELVTHRVVSPWSLRRLEEELLSGRSFGTFEASGFGKPQSTASGDGKVVVGFANGHSPKNLRLKMEYALYDLGKEKVVAHYTGPADQVAFNRSVLRESLTSLDVEPLLTDELDRPIRVDDPEAIRWVEAPLPAPPAPRVALPPGWVQEVAVPIACPGLASPDSALAASLRGDFTVSFRAAWWQSGPRSGEAASACSSRPGKLGADSYVSAAEWLGASYSVEGIFLESASGLLQLEAVAPDEKIGFVRDLFRAWVAKNRGHKLEALLFSFLVTHRSRLASSEAGISKAELLQPSGCSRGSPHPRGFDRDRDPRCPESSASSALSSL